MVEVLHGDCVELMRSMPDCSVDAIVTDPPYELGMMGKAWDGAGIAYSVTMWGEALRVLKPGGHLLAFGGTRTYHRMACAIEDAGFEIRDSIHWVYGSGFPKSLNIGKQDGCERWEGWGTALKPAHEPVVVARKPLSGTVAANVLEHGTGGLNIDGCRVGTTVETWPASRAVPQFGANMQYGESAKATRTAKTGSVPSGRWPANVVFDRTAGEALDRQSGERPEGRFPGPTTGTHAATSFSIGNNYSPARDLTDSGGASRFFTQADWSDDDWPFVYQAKPSRKERNAGLDKLEERSTGFGTRYCSSCGKNVPERGSCGCDADVEIRSAAPQANTHPTVKPVALMRHLVRLVTPPGGTVLDPFAGSGTTLVAAILEGFDCIGCEMTDEYLPIIKARVAWAQQQAAAEPPRLL